MVRSWATLWSNIAGVSLSVNVFYTIYVIFLWYVTPPECYVLKALSVLWRLLGNTTWLTLFFFSKEKQEKRWNQIKTTELTCHRRKQRHHQSMMLLVQLWTDKCQLLPCLYSLLGWLSDSFIEGFLALK